ncbi:MAG: hypothetical protein H6Q15_246 [Bacteroidetes bacterium]|nr:hypothetical protein [Bacteroidota bacterium]
MKLVSRKFSDSFLFFSLIFLGLNICMPAFFKTLSIILFTLSIIYTYSSRTYSFDIKSLLDIKKLLLISLFIVYAIGCIYSSDSIEARKDIMVKLPFILLPILFILSPKEHLTKKKLWYYGLSFIAGLLILEIILITHAILNGLNSSLPFIYSITYTKLSANNHPSYMSMYSMVAFILIYKTPLIELFKLDKKRSFIIKLSSSIFLTLFTILLNSRSGFICLTATYIWIFFDLIIIEKKFKTAFLLISIIASFYFLIFQISGLNKRYINASKNITTEKLEKSTSGSMNQRRFIYLNVHKTIFENPIFGVGTGDVKIALEELYKDNGVRFEHYLNAHNQFLQTTLAIGAIGLIVLLAIFIVPFFQSFQTKDFFVGAVLVIIGISFLFESILERQMGVHFFSFTYLWFSSYLMAKE